MSASWIVLGLVAALGAAGVALFGKVGLGGVDPTLATTLRAVVMAAVLVTVSLATGRFRGVLDGSAGVDRRAVGFIVLAALSGAVSWLAYFAALRVGGAVQVAAIDRLSLVFVLLFAALFFDEAYGWRGWLGVGLVVLGVALVARDRPSNSGAQNGGEAGGATTSAVVSDPDPAGPGGRP